MLSRKSKQKAKPSESDSAWGDGDFWGEAPSQASPAPSFAEAPVSVGPPTRRRPLLEHLEPLFLFICQQHRIARESKGGTMSIDAVREGIRRRIDDIETAARQDPLLRQHLDKLKDPIFWYVDSTFGSPENAFPFRQQWNDARMGVYTGDGNLAGDDAFFDELDKELQMNPADEAANERLAFYYTAIGLGFTGRYFKRSPEHRAALKALMDRIYPRITRYLDTDGSGKITPESYRFTDKRDFVAPARDKPIIFLAAFLLLLATLLGGYIHWYQQRKSSLEININNIRENILEVDSK